jgi:UDPglucose 6-dehydrogenase
LIEKSTVPVGTHKNIWDILKKHNENPDDVFTIVSMPEFLAEGVAIHNLLHPDRIVIGTPQNENGINSFNLCASLYKSIEDTKVINVRQASSELGKLFSNAMLAQRISSINSVSELCEITGASV